MLFFKLANRDKWSFHLFPPLEKPQKRYRGLTDTTEQYYFFMANIGRSLGSESKMPESREIFPNHFSGKVHFSTVLGNKIFPSPNYFPPNSEHPMSIDIYFGCFCLVLILR